MQQSGMNFDASGGVISAHDLQEQRRKRGQCITCGQKVYEKRPFPLKSIPLTVDQLVLNGRCLVCNPLAQDSGQNYDGDGASSANDGGNNNVNKTKGRRTSRRFATSTDTSITAGRSSRPAQSIMIRNSNRDDENGPDDRLAAMSKSKGHKSMFINSISKSKKKITRNRSFELKKAIDEDDNPWMTSIQEGKSNKNADWSIPSNGTKVGENDSKPAFDRRAQMQNIKPQLNETSEKDAQISTSIRKISTTSDVKEIVTEMQANPNVQDIQQEACKALGSLSLSQTDRESVAEQGGLESIINAMQASPDDQNIQETSCRALWNLSALESNQRDIAACGGIPIIIQAMEKFKTVPSLQEKAIAALSNLGAIEENQIIILEQGGVAAIIDAMNKNLEDIEVQEKGCAAITNLASRSKEIKSGIAKADGINAVVVAMMFHECDPELQENALRALRNMCANDDENKKLVAAASGISYVICAMQNHRDDAGVQEQGCWTLSNLAANKQNKSFIGENGGIDCIVLAMWHHFDKAAVQEWGCRALWTLCLDVNNKAITAKVGGIGAVVNAMRTHQNVAAVQEKGCGVFITLAANSDENKVRIVDDDGLDVIVMAMMIHQDSKLVQDRACSALKRLAFGPNLMSFKTFGVPELLQQAKNNFPNECGRKVDEIMSVLGSISG